MHLYVKCKNEADLRGLYILKKLVKNMQKRIEYFSNISRTLPLWKNGAQTQMSKKIKK